MVKLAR